jgi:eukaryotic-like serine/threonine-protein kinase
LFLVPVSPGDKFGPYEITARIGEGGMGEVWKAHDSRLKRDVAIKVSAAQFSERFEREAQAIAALNHPNICLLYDVGPDYLVMEYIEGAPLKRPLPLDQALKYSVQICDALDAAHKKGITHRDLKPANILATKSGIKLLDFGLAKFGTSAAGLAAKPPNDATVSMALTGNNEIMGTLYYMSPEQLQAQANGQEIDGRSDIFSFGLVLYEMLTGKRAFEGSSPASVIAAIMERPAPSIASIAPPALDRLLQRCLAKDPDERWQSARDLKADLEWIASALASGNAVPAALKVPAALNKKSRLGWLAWGLVPLFALAAAAVSFIHFRDGPPVTEPMRFQVPAPDKNSIFSPPLLSPDGRNMAFVAIGENGIYRLWLRALNSLEAKPLAESYFGQGNGYFWSADSRYVAHAFNGKLRKVDVASGSSQTICDIPSSFFGGAWNADGVILFGTDHGLQRVSASGGTPTAVTASGPKTGKYHGLPWFLPDGQHFVYLGSFSIENGRLYAGTLEDAPDKQNYTPLLSNVGSGAQYTRSAGAKNGYLLFVRDDQLLAQPFNASRLALGGAPEVVADQIWNDGSLWGYFSVSGANLAYGVRPRGGEGQLTWFDRQGVSLGTVGAPGPYSDIALSRDGKQVAAARGGEILLTDLARNVTFKFTSGPGQKRSPIWTRDGSRIVFTLVRDGVEQISVKPVSGTTEEERLYKSEEAKIPAFWSSDGRFLAYTVQKDLQGELQESWVLPLGRDAKPSGPPKLFAESAQAQVSPDGHWIVDTSNESGTYEVWVRSFPDGNTKLLLSKGGGVEPWWRGDGKEIFYRRLTGELVAVEVTTSPTFRIGASKVLFQTRFAGAAGLHNPAWTPSADGKRFLGIVRPKQSGDDIPITMVVNWQSELKK